MGFHSTNCGCPWCEGERYNEQCKKQKKCTHTHPNGQSAIEYDSIYEMRTQFMHCTICGKDGSWNELINDTKERGED